MFADLSSAKWTRREGLQSLTEALGAENIRWVGGAIRDSLLGSEVSDVDCATRHHPEAVIELCQQAGIRTVPTGIEHGTITAVLKGGPIEITTLRRDVATDGRRATVAFAQNWEEDAARRDFTINALYAHPQTLEISDYFGGLDDLAARRVRFIGDARERINEDHLRILRYFRFQARFGAELDKEAEAACADLASTLKGLSRERVSAELVGLLKLPDPHATVARMHELGVLQQVLPEATRVNIGKLGELIERERSQGIEPHPIRRFNALLPPSPEVAEKVSASLRLSRSQRAHLVANSAHMASDLDTPALIAYRETLPVAIDRVLLEGGDARELLEWQVPEFPLKGRDVIARGVTAGPDVARILRLVESAWIEEGFPGRARALELLEQYLSQRGDVS